MQEPVSAAGGFTRLNDLNDSGRLVGFSNDASLTPQAAYWDDPATPTLLPRLFPSQGLSSVIAVNEEGVMVGNILDEFDLGYGVIWTDTGAVALNDLIADPLLTVSEVFDINDRGEILVEIFDANIFQSYSAVLTPIPTPATLACAAIALIGAARRHRR